MTTTNNPAAEPPSSFGLLSVAAPIARALAAMKYTTPTPIQESAIPPLRDGRDVLGQAETGTGKTAGFGIPLIEAMEIKQRAVQAIVLVPTRELCLQVAEEIAQLGQYAGVRVLPVYGGVGLGRQTDALRRGVHIVVGTPGRVEDLLQRNILTLSSVRFAILDEADRMLDVGFLAAIERILHRTPSTRQTALFSATMPADVRHLAQRQMRGALTIGDVDAQATVDLIEQRFEPVPTGDKLAALTAHLDDPACNLVLIFRRTTRHADRLTQDLAKQGYKVAVLHGRRTQGQRERVLAQLKAGEIQALVATDIAARGLDITGLTHVFNYDLPDTTETYTHRIGRTGRAGRTGVAITLVAPEDEPGVRLIKNDLTRRRTGAAPTTGKARLLSSAGKTRGSARTGPTRTGPTTRTEPTQTVPPPRRDQDRPRQQATSDAPTKPSPSSETKETATPPRSRRPNFSRRRPQSGGAS